MRKNGTRSIGRTCSNGGQKRVAELTEGKRTFRELHGLEAWFRAPGAPPRWKMALLTWSGVWPTTWLVGTLIGPHLSDIPRLVSAAVIAAAIVVCLTWAIMPALVKLFHAWLR